MDIFISRTCSLYTRGQINECRSNVYVRNSVNLDRLGKIIKETPIYRLHREHELTGYRESKTHTHTQSERQNYTTDILFIQYLTDMENYKDK